jgi:DNA-binding beta-propeller fold protein YncE
MDVESRLRRALEHEAASVEQDLADALSTVHGLARRRDRRRTALIVTAAAAAVVAVAAAIGARGALHRAEPAPAHGPDRSRMSLSIIAERSAADLGIERALSVAVGAGGQVYVTDTSQHVTELTPDLRPVRSWGGGGTRPGKFRLIQGSITAGPQGRVYVSDTGNFRIQEFTPTGRFVGQVGSFGTGPGQFTWPFDIAVDAEGNVYVTDDRAETVTKLAPSGRQIWRRGGLGVETDPRLLGHEHLAGFDPAGHLVTVNDDAGEVLVWNGLGQVIRAFGTQNASAQHTPGTISGLTTFPRGACDVTADLAGRLYITSCDEDSDPHWSGIFSADGTLLGSRANSSLAESPRWSPNGHGYAVTISGGVAELKTITH